MRKLARIKEEGRIIILDSFGHSRTRAIEALQKYLVHEALDKLERPLMSKPRGITAKVPKQPNHCDCGVYLLHYAEMFLSDPDSFLDDIFVSFSI